MHSSIYRHKYINYWDRRDRKSGKVRVLLYISLCVCVCVKSSHSYFCQDLPVIKVILCHEVSFFFFLHAKPVKYQYLLSSIYNSKIEIVVNLSSLFSLADTLKKGKGGGKIYTQLNMIIWVGNWTISITHYAKKKKTT